MYCILILFLIIVSQGDIWLDFSSHFFNIFIDNRYIIIYNIGERWDKHGTFS